MRIKHLLLFALGVIVTLNSCKKEDPKEVHNRAMNEALAKGGEFKVLEDKYKSEDEDPVKVGEGNAFIEGAGSDAMNSDFYTRKRSYDICSTPEEFATMSPWAGVMWPGCIIQGRTLNDGVPSGVPFSSTDRTQQRIYLNIVSGNTAMDTWYRDVEMRESNVVQAQNDILSEYGENTHPAQYSIRIEKVSSIEDMAAKLGVNVKIGGFKLQSDFQTKFNSSKNYVAVKLYQTYYTMVLDPGDVSYFGFFQPTILPEKLAPFTGSGNPLCYVKSVSYGRIFVMLYESSNSSSDMSAAISSSYRSAFGVTGEVNKSAEFNSMQVTAVQYGGNPVEGLTAVFGNADKLKDFIVNGAHFGKNSVGAPISMRVEYLYNNMLARISNASKYEVTERFAVPKSKTNFIGVDVMSVEGGSVEGKKYVHSDSYCEIKEIKVSQIDNTGIEGMNKIISATQPKRYNRNGFEEGIYKITPLGQLGANPVVGTSIKVSAKVKVWSKTCSAKIDPWVSDEVDNVTITQTFTYTSDGWKVGNNDSSKGNPYFNVSRTINFPKTAARCRVDLNFRLLVDGLEIGG